MNFNVKEQDLDERALMSRKADVLAMFSHFQGRSFIEPTNLFVVKKRVEDMEDNDE